MVLGGATAEDRAVKDPRTNVATEGAATFVCGVCGQPVRIDEDGDREFIVDVTRFEQVHGRCLRRGTTARRPAAQPGPAARPSR